nr:50S ribosomal protein L5P, large subunit ribosomal protein L5 [uncultured archaeon]
MIEKKLQNKMRTIRIEKIVLNIGAGTEADNVEKAVQLLGRISGKKSVKTLTTKRIANWKLRPGLPVGAMVTLRGKPAEELLKRLLQAIEFEMAKESFTENGFSFGIKEYIDIPGVKYDPKTGVIGLEVSVRLMRPGFSVKRRKKRKGKIAKVHKILAEDSLNFAKSLGVKLK